MYTLKNVALAIIGAVTFALAVRTGYQAEKEANSAHQAVYQ